MHGEIVKFVVEFKQPRHDLRSVISVAALHHRVLAVSISFQSRRTANNKIIYFWYSKQQPKVSNWLKFTGRCICSLSLLYL